MADDGSPFVEGHFQRVDESDDALFYREARLVTHIDDGAIAALRAHYATIFPAQSAVLDLMSSWVSHFPADFRPGRAAGLGMNAAELDANPALTERATQDLNRAPTLPYSDASFDVVTIAVSVQYLTQPVAVFGEIQRVLRPGGICAVSFSNRCFPTKAVALWSAMNDAGHAQIVEAYFTQAGGFDAAESLRLPTDVGADPMFVVQARRPAP
ncbi:MAG: Ubiquinone/menaquinone biosynthesis C-methylase UbiE [Chloroflexi bacterium]|jgi:SAM-dependent methyltransferase|nr:MAG: Ubiquinone/menaquinone biosynthesis C-methylase UbiE [Chloroflexota bacterium]